jgi:hypothetical protein
VLPASSTLLAQSWTKVPHPASKIDLFKTRFRSGSIGQIFAGLFLLLGFWCRRQVLDLEIFKDDHPILVDELTGFFVVEVAATIAHFAIEA